MLATPAFSLTAQGISAGEALTPGTTVLRLAEDQPIIAQSANDARPVHNEVKGDVGEARYILLLRDEPLATYAGGVAGLDATSPQVTGAGKLDVESQASLAYVDYLQAEQAGFISSVSISLGRSVEVVFQFQHAVNGMVLVLSPDEAARLAQRPEVVLVERETAYPVDTDTSPAFLGLPSFWDGTNVSGGVGNQGEGMILGVIDTGINMDHPSFASPGPKDGYVFTNPKGHFLGVCDPNDAQYNAAMVCNNKLIGAYDFVYSVTPVGKIDYPTPEDEDGHGSHTGSTAAGNSLDAVMLAPTVAVTREISGMAPHANIIAYDACYHDPVAGGGLCPSTATLASANQAVQDGVDAINYSIGGGDTPYSDAVELAFLNLVESGTFVSASAGNSGPGAATTGHRGPWVSAAAASTHNRVFINQLGSFQGSGTPPVNMTGKGFTSGYGPASIVYAGNYTSTILQDGLCLHPFPAGTFHGEIVVCDRGNNPRTEKAENVKAGGAGGFVLANNAPNGSSLNGDAFALPGIHITYDNGTALKNWLSSGTVHTATIAGISYDISAANGDILAAFSSRGPNTSLDVLKPNISAPGVDIWAATLTPDPAHPSASPEFTFLSGTSMASPHIAGIGLLLKKLHPTWSPAMILSALMTTSKTGLLKEDAVTPADPFDVGAGRVDMTRAGKAGFVLDETGADFQAADPSQGGDPGTLNLASFMNSACLASCAWTRTLSSTMNVSVTWTASMTATPGVTLTVSPSSFTLGPFGTQQIQVTADVSGIPVGTWAFGQVILSPGSAGVPVAHLPVAVMPIPSAFPELLLVDTRRNAGSYLAEGLRSRSASSMSSQEFGLIQAETVVSSLPQANAPDNPLLLPDPGKLVVTTTVPAGSSRLAAEITQSHASDIDLYVYRDANQDGTPAAGELVCQSATGALLEYCNVSNPVPGSYILLVINFHASASGAKDFTELAYGAVAPNDAGNMSLSTPASVTAGADYSVRLFWDIPTMKAGDRYYGVFSLGSDPAHPANLGTVPVDIRRAEDDVVKTASQQNARPGDTLTYTLDIRQNLDQAGMLYTITDTLPSGLAYVTGTLTATSGAASVVGNTIRWQGKLRASGLGLSPAAGTFRDISKISGVSPAPCLSAECDEDILSVNGLDFYYYGVHYDSLKMAVNGFLIPGSPNTIGVDIAHNQELPDITPPNTVIAPWWTDLDLAGTDPAGAGNWYIVNLTNGVSNYYVAQWSGAQLWGDPTSVYTFQVWIQKGTENIWFSYDTARGNTSVATVGIEDEKATHGFTYTYNGAGPNPFNPANDLNVQVIPGASAQVMFQARLTQPGPLTNIAVHNTDMPGSKPAQAKSSLSSRSFYPLIELRTSP
jgi:uncharacterized repeat protein (TIGR01451 family)